MDEYGYRNFLHNEGLTDKAINPRITRANRVEREFSVNLDYAIQDDERMLDLRKQIYDSYGGDGSLPGNLYNAVTKYYKFKNGREMHRVK